MTRAADPTGGASSRHPIRCLAAIASALALGVLALACSPKVGSDAWCERIKEKPKGDWTANEAADFARHCVFR